jgi:transcriptional regulator with XRE-family HTH domain
MEKLAQMAEMEYKQLSNVELGETDASVSTLSALCKALGISLMELMDVEGLR